MLDYIVKDLEKIFNTEQVQKVTEETKVRNSTIRHPASRKIGEEA